MMPTFYDPIEMEDINIDDNVARFYIIRLPNNAGFKLCATTQDLNSQQMIGGDPETRIKGYWPIARDQLNGANLDVLFPGDKLRTAPLDIQELNDAFHFDPPFDPDNFPQETFGLQHGVDADAASEARRMHDLIVGQVIELPMAYETILNPMALVFGDADAVARWQEWLVIAQQHIMPLAIAAGMSPSGLPHYLSGVDRLMNSREALVAIRDGIFSLNELAAIEQARLIDTVLQDMHKLVPDIQAGKYTLQDILNIHQQALQMNVPLSDFTRIIHSYPQCIAAIRDNLIPLQDLMNLPDESFILVTDQKTIQAMSEGRTTFEVLRNLPLEELRDAVAADEYPGHGIGPGH